MTFYSLIVNWASFDEALSLIISIKFINKIFDVDKLSTFVSTYTWQYSVATPLHLGENAGKH